MLGLLSEFGGTIGIGHEGLHVLGGVEWIGVGPELAFFVGSVVLGELGELEGDGISVAGVYEFAGGGPVCGDDGLFEKHAFGDGEAEAFGSVQGHVGVAGGHEAVGHISGEGSVDEVAVGQPFQESLKLLVGGFVVVRRVDFDDESDVVRSIASHEGFAEGFDGGLRVFAFLVAVEVVGEGEEKLVAWQAELLSVVAVRY